jgi:hypothetical protein
MAIIALILFTRLTDMIKEASAMKVRQNLGPEFDGWESALYQTDERTS